MFLNGKIIILLATYNGEKYISRQIDSLLNQTYKNWHLLVRDDGSTDRTLSVIETYRIHYPEKIEILPNRENRGSLFNFSALLEAAPDAEYIMFCDQDDEWQHGKIENTFRKMKEREQQYGNHYPVLIFTNFQYVDEDMRIIESKKDFDINRLGELQFSHLLAHNPVYGCTTMLNRTLADKVGIIPPQADFHDHWIALVAAAFGEIYYIKEKTVLYRQHGNNLSGSFDNDSVQKRFQRIVMQRKNIKEAKAKLTMLSAFKNRYYSCLNGEQKVTIDRFLVLYSHKNPLLFFKSFFAGVRCQTLAQTLLMYATIFFSKGLRNPSHS